MSKAIITKLFIGSLVALAGGLLLMIVAGALAIANNSFVMNGPDVVGVKSSPFGWAMVGVAGLGVLVMVAAAIGQFVAWLGAVVNTAQLPDKLWFVVLLVTGLLSFGFVAMIVYLVAGPADPASLQGAGLPPAAPATAAGGPVSPRTPAEVR